MRKISLMFSLVISFLFTQNNFNPAYMASFGSVTIDGKLYNQISFRPEFSTNKIGMGFDIYLYFDGVQKGTLGNSNHNHTSTSFTLGNYGGGGNYKWQGYVSDFRIVKGKAVYTGNFSPPTGPLTKTGGTYPNNTNRTDPTASETVLLTHQDTSGTTVPTDNSDSNHTLTKSGTITKGAGYNVATLSDGSSNNVTVTKGANHLVLTSDGPFA